MKTFLQTLFFFLLVTQICFGQWLHQNSGTNINLSGLYFIDSNTGWVVGDEGLIIKTTNGGVIWEPQTSSTTLKLAEVSFIDSTTGWAVGGDYISYNTKILKTTNGGADWIAQIDTSGPLLYDCFFIDSITGWAVGDYSLILKTTNGGSSWTKQYEGSWEPGFRCVFFIDYNNGWVVGWNGAMMRTSDGGTNWIIYSSDLWGETLDDIFFSDSNSGWIVGLGFYKMLRTTDGGKNWFLQNTPLSGGLAAICFIGNNGWASGGNGTILHTSNAGVTFIEEEKFEVVPTNLSLSQNYPNPFNPITSFTYSIPAQANVTIKVFDITGNEIETLVNEEKPAGSYEITWYTANLPSGVYFYQLKAGNFIETKKMLLLK